MSEFYRTIGKFIARTASREGIVSGFLSAVDPRVVAKAVNENADLLTQTVSHLDPRILAEAMTSDPDFMAKLIRNLDAAAIARALNKNQRFVTQMIENTDPNIFSRSVNVVFNKMRSATYRPGLAATEKGGEAPG